MKPSLLSVGVATPDGVLSREQAVALSDKVAPVHASRPLLERLHERSGVATRHGVIFGESGQQTLYSPPSDLKQQGPSTRERMALYEQHAPVLAERAARQALQDASITAGGITHLVTASCTGFCAPGVDAELIARLGLSPDVRRTHIGFMGCHAAINALSVAAAFASDPAARVLVVCVELCTLHMHYGDRTDQLVANALFADGAAAAVVTQTRDAQSPQIAGTSSRVFRDADGAPLADRMRWEITNHGFAMTLGKDVPDLLAAVVPAWSDEVLVAHELTRADVARWIIHPGGPRIVQALSDALHLAEPIRLRAVEAARTVLHDYGNMSSATVLFMLRALLQADSSRPVVTMAFGPGLAGELMVLR